MVPRFTATLPDDIINLHSYDFLWDAECKLCADLTFECTGEGGGG